MDADAENYNQPPYVLSFFPSGEGEKKDTTLCIDNQRVLLSAMRGTEKGILIRLFNTSGTAETATLIYRGQGFFISLMPCEIKTYIYKEGEFEEMDMISLS